MTQLVKGLQDSATELEDSLDGHHFADLLEEAKHFNGVVLPAMSKVRKFADELEGIVADDIWALPTYQEMLFVK